MFDERANRGPEFIAIFTVGLALAAVSVVLRLWVRWKIIRKFGLDDGFAAASLVVTLGSYACLVSSVHHGMGKHFATLTHEQSIRTLKMLWAAMFMTPSAEAFAKISISIMLIRITTSFRWKVFFYTLIGIFTSVTVITLVADTTLCRPITLLWDYLGRGSCNTTAEAYTAYLQGVSAAVYDVLLALSPIFLLWKVQISFHRKLLICGLLSLGFFTSVSGIIRTVYTPGGLDPTDITYTAMPYLIWKSVELPLSILVGCLPTLQPLIPVIHRLWSKQQTKRSYQIQNEAHILHQSKESQIYKDNAVVGVESYGSYTERQVPENDLV